MDEQRRDWVRALVWASLVAFGVAFWVGLVWVFGGIR